MPEIKHHFRAGKMNKDLDERLVPNGEYRDALNIEIATSDGDDVGALQTVLGNNREDVTSYVSGVYNTIAARMGDIWTIDGKCIGHCLDTQNEKIYYFVADANFGGIFEFEQKNPEISSTKSGVIKPVLLDRTTGVTLLQFSTSNRITGINVVDGILFWTDGVSEPKKINIQKFKDYTNDDLSQTTQIDGSNFAEEHITVIRKNPTLAPVLNMLRTKHAMPITTTIDYLFTDDNGDPFESGDVLSALQFTPTPAYETGDPIKLTYTDPTDNTEYEIRASIQSSGTVFDVILDSVPFDVPSSTVVWDVELIDEDPLFETKFPRFSYRYKYDDGEYSCYAPWSEIAFLADDFDYEPKKGYNLGMVNQLRSLKITNFTKNSSGTVTVPWDVVEIDILYKTSDANNVYTVKTLKKVGVNNQPDPEWTADSLEVTSEVIHKVVSPNQLLRPWDNVPLKAKAQELTANRLMYGNYTENFNMLDYNNENISPIFEFNITNRSDQPTNTDEGYKSIKSQRTYQLGVVYRDDYGRETPVFTDQQTGALKLPKAFATGYNQITASITTNPPSWAKSYKYYVKETSAEYYNLAMDRYYPAEDGNIWLSFPSAERNKITEESFITLKKEHDNSIFVSETAKYKVIAIENEAPEFIKRSWVHKAIIRSGVAAYDKAADDDGDMNWDTFTGGPFFTFSSAPQENRNFVDIPKPLWDGGHLSSYAQELHSMPDLAMRFKTSSAKSQWYEIKGMSLINASADEESNFWRIEIKKKFEGDVAFVTTDSDGNGTKDTVTGGVDVIIAQREIKNKPEFAGRFFTKIYRDSVLNDYIMMEQVEEEPFEKYLIDLPNDTNTATPIVNTYGGNKAAGLVRFWLQYSWQPEDKRAGWFIDRSKYVCNSDNSWRNQSCRDKHFYVANSQQNEEGNSYLNSLNTPGASNEFDRGMNKQGYSTWEEARDETGKGMVEGSRFMDISFHNWGVRDGKKSRWTRVYDRFESSYHPEFYSVIQDGLQSTGSVFRMAQDTALIEYKIIGWTRSYYTCWTHSSSGCKEGRGKYATQRIIRWTLLLDKPLEETTIDAMAILGNSMVFIEQLGDDDDQGDFTSNNPAIWETEPKENIELDIYHEASNAYDITNPGTATAAHTPDQRLDWYNCFSFGNGVESDRIRDDYNAVQMDDGPRVSAVFAEQYKEEIRTNDIIYSGIFNSRSGTNRTNQFIQAESITKSLNPLYGGIQKLHARNTDLIALCEDKVLNIPCNKDILFNADGNPNVTKSSKVLGTAQPYAGEYGISKDPASFASYGYMAYFTDKSRGTVIRMERNGLIPIAEYGMTDYFKDKMRNCVDIVGSYDDNRDLYNLTLKTDETSGGCTSNTSNNVTISFSEKTKGWTSFKSFIQEDGVSLNNKYYTFKEGDMWLHHNNQTRNKFYDDQYQSEFILLLNDAPSTIKSFNTLNYEGSQGNVIVDNSGTNVLNPDGINQDVYYNNTTKVGWYCDYIKTDQTLGGQEGKVPEFLDKENKWFNYIQGVETTEDNLDQNEFSVQGIGQIVEDGTGSSGTNYVLTITQSQL